MPSSAFLPSHALIAPSRRSPPSRPAPYPTPSASLRDRPLRHRRVLLTGPYRHAARLAPLLLDAQARPVCAPVLHTHQPSESELHDLEDAVLRLSDYDLVLFLSHPAISAFANTLVSVAPDPTLAPIAFRASAVKIAALPTDALAVPELLNTTVDLIPADPSPIALATRLVDDPDWHHSRVLLPAPLVKHMSQSSLISELVRVLREEAHCSVTSVPAYVMRPTPSQLLSVELSQFDAVDAVVFSSSEDPGALTALLSTEQAHQFHARVHDRQIPVAAPDSATADVVAAHFDMDPNHVVVSRDYSLSGLVYALESVVAERSVQQGTLVLPDDPQPV